jgi:hypothetical protein
MAEYAFTAAEVLAGSTGSTQIAGEEIEAGEFCYLDAGDGGKAKLADSSMQAKAAVHGIALNHAFTDQPVQVLQSGAVTVPGATFLREAQVLTISSAAGEGLCENVEDLGDGEYATVVGWATDTEEFMLDITATGFAHSAPA